jgi:hypothetical protein
MGAVGVAGTLGASDALATSAADGVIFVHGTGDYTAPTSAASAATPSGGTAISDYWTSSSLGSMVSSPAGGSWSYGVAGYQGSSTDAMTSWSDVADQLWSYYYNGNGGAIYNVVVVTHSNGSNPIRYLLAHPTAVTNGGNTASTVISVIQKVIFIAGDNAGTPLADDVTTSGSLANIGNSITSFFGSNWNSPAVWQQVQSNMSSYNTNGTFATGSTPGGVAANYIYGSNVYAAIWSGDAWCGGYGTTTALKAAQLYGWGSTSAATDGFIGTSSSTYVGTDPNGYGGDSRLNHNQSRRSCHGVAPKIAAYVHGAMNGTFTATPPDYVEPPAVQACDVITPGWMTGTDQGSYYQWGCTSSMHSDTSTDIDCLAVYGSDNSVSIPMDYAQTAYSNSSYYSGSGGCSDSWLGDGQCDLCLLAKYGYDSKPGSTKADDCVNQGSGTTTKCADILYSSALSKNVYATITVTH